MATMETIVVVRNKIEPNWRNKLQRFHIFSCYDIIKLGKCSVFFDDGLMNLLIQD